MAACADQTTNRLWVLKTGSALMNRRIKARMLRAFRMALPAPQTFCNAKAFSGIYFFVPPCAAQPGRLGQRQSGRAPKVFNQPYWRW
jgi:hypothetical protein